jgi:hypothetical protein
MSNSLHARGPISQAEQKAIDEIQAAAQPIRVELVRPPVQIKTKIVLTTFETVPAPAPKSHELNWFDLIALFSLGSQACAKVAMVVDLAQLWT